MATKKSKAADVPQDNGTWVWRGGKKIELEKMDDRFTMIPTSRRHLEQLREVPGVRNVKEVTNQVFKVETVSTERDSLMKAMRSPTYGAVVHHAYKPKGSEGTVFYLTDKIILTLDRKATPAQVDALLNKYCLRVLKEYAGEDMSLLVQITGDSGGNPIKVANRLAEEKLVKSAEPNMVNRFRSAFIPPDGYFNRQWHLRAKRSAQVVAEASVHAPEAWDITRGDRSIVVAVIDDGFDLSHPDFQGEGKIVSPKDYVDGDASAFPDSTNDDYHGTPCAGVAIAESNGRGVVGVAHGCAFMPVRFPLSADDDLMIEIFEEVGKSPMLYHAVGDRPLCMRRYRQPSRIHLSVWPQRVGREARDA